MVPQLIEATGPHAGRVHELPYGNHVIGRGGDASILLDDKDVSRRHARIDVGPDGITIEDLGSKNGIYTRGKRITSPLMLGHGQSFSFGELTLTVSHPAAQVSRALAQAGETTVTTTRTHDRMHRDRLSLLLPVLGVLVFGALVTAMLML